MNSYDTKETLTPADLFVARQSDVLRKYYEMMVDQVKTIGGPTEAGQQPGTQFNRNRVKLENSLYSQLCRHFTNKV